MNSTVTWICQGGYIFEADGKRLVVDPYLSDLVERKEGLHRLPCPTFEIADLRPDVVVCTHNHMDHCDPDTIGPLYRASPDSLYAGPSSVSAHYARLGIARARIVEAPKGTTLPFGTFTITTVAAKHSDPDAVGLLIEVDGLRIYLSGDTLFDPALVAGLPARPDLMFICVNGRLGNMTLDEALQTVDLLHPRAAIPMHYGLFAENTVDPAPFVAGCLARGVRSMVLDMGKPCDLIAIQGG
jgi:L-ascorbate metabolism protein UlaG (beta-lactamase superfamily)